MPQLGPLEILTLATVALIVLGPQKLPEVARSVGRFMSEIRRMASDVRAEFSAGLAADEDDYDAVDDEDAAAIEDAARKPVSEES